MPIDWSVCAIRGYMSEFWPREIQLGSVLMRFSLASEWLLSKNVVWVERLKFKSPNEKEVCYEMIKGASPSLREMKVPRLSSFCDKRMEDVQWNRCAGGHMVSLGAWIRRRQDSERWKLACHDFWASSPLHLLLPYNRHVAWELKASPLRSIPGEMQGWRPKSPGFRLLLDWRRYMLCERRQEETPSQKCVYKSMKFWKEMVQVQGCLETSQPKPHEGGQVSSLRKSPHSEFITHKDLRCQAESAKQVLGAQLVRSEPSQLIKSNGSNTR